MYKIFRIHQKKLCPFEKLYEIDLAGVSVINICFQVEATKVFAAVRET